MFQLFINRRQEWCNGKSQVTGIESWKVVRVKLRRLGLVVVDRKKKKCLFNNNYCSACFAWGVVSVEDILRELHQN